MRAVEWGIPAGRSREVLESGDSSGRGLLQTLGATLRHMVHVRQFVPNDTSGVVALILPIQQVEFGIPVTLEDQPDLGDIGGYYQQGYGNFWVADADGQIVGTIGLLDIGNHRAALRKMFVAERYRGTEPRVAQRLLETLLAWSASKAVTEIYLGTTEEFLAAHRFYEKNRFVEIPKSELPTTFPRMAVDTKFYRRGVHSMRDGKPPRDDGMQRTTPKAVATYNAAADHYDVGFWDRYGRRTIARLDLRPGARVLDVACGTGASALPAAEAVGPEGRVVAVDLAEKMLECARRKALARGLGNIEFRLGDMTALGYPDAEFSAVVCVFGVFFVADMAALVADLWRMVKPRGKLAITTWGPRIFEPMYSRWNEAVRAERQDLHAAFNPWDRIVEPESVRRLFEDAGVPAVEVFAESGRQRLATPEDWWTIVLGSGLRWTVEQLGPEAADRVRRDNLDWARRNAVESVETNVIYATATRDV